MGTKIADLCNEKLHLCGTNDSSLRRQVQNKVNKWELLPASECAKQKRGLSAGVPKTPTVSQPTLPQRTLPTPSTGALTRNVSFSPFTCASKPLHHTQSVTMIGLSWENIQFGPSESFIAVLALLPPSKTHCASFSPQTTPSALTHQTYIHIMSLH